MPLEDSTYTDFISLDVDSFLYLDLLVFSYPLMGSHVYKQLWIECITLSYQYRVNFHVPGRLYTPVRKAGLDFNVYP